MVVVTFEYIKGVLIVEDQPLEKWCLHTREIRDDLGHLTSCPCMAVENSPSREMRDEELHDGFDVSRDEVLVVGVVQVDWVQSDVDI